MHFHNELIQLDACQEARLWAADQPNQREVLRNCPRGDWLLWLAAHRCETANWPIKRRLAAFIATLFLNHVADVQTPAVVTNFMQGVIDFNQGQITLGTLVSLGQALIQYRNSDVTNNHKVTRACYLIQWILDGKPNPVACISQIPENTWNNILAAIKNFLPNPDDVEE